MKRTIDFRYRVLRNGGNFCLLQPAANSAPTVRMDDSGEIKTSFSGVFLIPDADVNWMSDEIRPELIVDGVTFPLGVFLPATVSETDNGISKSIQILLPILQKNPGQVIPPFFRKAFTTDGKPHSAAVIWFLFQIRKL